jgi:predicted RecB family nuclease
VAEAQGVTHREEQARDRFALPLCLVFFNRRDKEVAQHRPRGDLMATKITRDIIESYLNCKYKGHLKLAGESGTQSDYATITTAARMSSREQTLARLAARFGVEDACRGSTVTVATLKQGAPLLVDADLNHETLSLRYDALKRADGASKLGDHHYVPVLHHGNEVGQRQRLLLAVLGLGLDHVQGVKPVVGLVAQGSDSQLGKVRLDARLYRQADQVLDEVKRLQQGGESPRLTLNGHCQVCEFRQRCRTQAEQADDISLLRGMKEKEVRAYARKGILTVAQLSHTFQPRRQNKRQAQRMPRRSHALHALAIRDKKVYVFGSPALPGSSVRIYLDMEGDPEGGYVYLIGMVVVRDGAETSYSFWADSNEQEEEIFEQFLAEVSRYEGASLFCYGGYELAFLKRMRKVAKSKEQVDRVLGALVNVLSLVYAHVYFPCYSNGLKEVGNYLGCLWTEPDASGIQSIVWRKGWENTRGGEWKQKLLTLQPGRLCRAQKGNRIPFHSPEQSHPFGKPGRGR